jgi:broad specificity phosphatase PhoE
MLTRGDEDPPSIITSPLLRARQTAVHLEASLGVPAVVDERWLEVDYGVFDGRPLTSVPEDLWHRWRSDETFAPEGGESLGAVHERVTEACLELLAERRTVIVVSHVSPIKSAVAWALGATSGIGWRTHLDNASVSRINLGPRGAALAGFNETGHLF